MLKPQPKRNISDQIAGMLENTSRKSNSHTAGPSGRGVLRRGLRPLSCWDCGFESDRGHGCLCVVSVVFFQVEVSATGWSLVQRSPTNCGASLCVIKKPREWGFPGPLGGCRAKIKQTLITEYPLNLALSLLMALAAEDYLAVRRHVTFKHRQVCLP